jgi:hypothetical protein
MKFGIDSGRSGSMLSSLLFLVVWASFLVFILSLVVAILQILNPESLGEPITALLLGLGSSLVLLPVCLILVILNPTLKGRDAAFAALLFLVAAAACLMTFPHEVGFLGFLFCVVPAWFCGLLSASEYRRHLMVMPRGCCTRCGYDLTGNVSGVCPECGTPVVSANSGAQSKGAEN